MKIDEAKIGTRVRTRVGWSGVPVFTEGVIDEMYQWGVMVCWDFGTLPKNYVVYDGRPAIASGLLRDGFGWDELKDLDVVDSVQMQFRR